MNGTAFQDKISCIIYRITKSIADRLCRSIILFPACIKAVYLTAPGIKTPVYATNFLSGIFDKGRPYIPGPGIVRFYGKNVDVF